MWYATVNGVHKQINTRNDFAGLNERCVCGKVKKGIASVFLMRGRERVQEPTIEIKFQRKVSDIPKDFIGNGDDLIKLPIEING